MSFHSALSYETLYITRLTLSVLFFFSPTTGSEIIDNGANNKSSNSDDNEIGLLGVGCGLAEVELPMKYKLANIQETEIARQKMLDIRATKAMSTNIGKNNTMQSSSSSIEFTTKSIGGDFASFRYQKAYAIAFIPSGFGRSQDNKDKDKDTMSAKTSGRRTNEVSEPVALTHPTVPLPSNKTEVYTKSEYHSKSAGTRSDDYMVQQFKKVRICYNYDYTFIFLFNSFLFILFYFIVSSS